MSIFKAYDIRGIYPEQLDEEIITKIGQAYADILKEELHKEEITIVIGYDMRLSSESLTQHLIKGVTLQGVNVIDIGLISTPTFYFSIGKLNADGGMIVTASHNPKEYNGIKIVKANAYPVGGETGIYDIEKRVLENRFQEPSKQGSISTYENVIDDEIEYVLKHTDITSIKPLKIVADVANSMGAQYLEKLFDKLPCELVRMNFELDGTFPVHEADPFKPENRIDIEKKAKEINADLGITTDGDGDRIFFIDDSGHTIEPAIARGLISQIVLQEHPGAKIGFDIRPGRITQDMILEHGGVPILTKVGHSLIKEKSIKEGVEFAGESSGHFCIKTDYGFFELPTLIIVKLLQYISNEPQKLSQIVKPLQKYAHSGELSFKVNNKQEKISAIRNRCSDANSISDLDGITIEYDTYWFNVRASNTEPLLRLTVEGVSQEIVDAKTKELTELIKA